MRQLELRPFRSSSRNENQLLAMPPQCGEGVRHGQHDHMIIGRNEIGVQHMIKVFAQGPAQ